MINLLDINYICIDLDGTLLNSSKCIDEDTVSILKQCIAEGKKIVLVSGRHFNEILPYANLLGLTSEDYVISCDGEYILKCDGTKIWSSAKLSISEVKYISKCLNTDTFSIITDQLNIHIIKSFFCRLKSQIIGILTGSSNRYWALNDARLSKLSNIEKVVIYKKGIDISSNLLNQFCVHNLDEGRLEFLPFGVNKYESLCMLEQLGVIRLASSLYFGNDFNDYECFDKMTNTIAMKDSPSRILEKASYVTDSCDCKGVYNALKNLMLI